MTIEIKDFSLTSGSSQFAGSESDLLSDEGFLKIKEIHEHLLRQGWCHVRVKGGDYDGSIAKFTVDNTLTENRLYWRMYCSEPRYGVNCYWCGKLSWKGKRNNPQFTVMNNTCEVLLGYEGDEILHRLNLNKEGKKLLEQPIYDIDNKYLSVGDKVLYMNLRYGSGGCLCHGVVKEFKPHVRDGYVSVIITHSSGEEESECRQPYNQIYKK